MTKSSSPDFSVALAQTPGDLRAAQRLRYDVFVEELGGGGSDVDHDERVEKDHFDAYCDHLILTDRSKDKVAGVYRLMNREQAEAAGGFYSASEYDLSCLLAHKRPVLELGRSCLHPDYRGGLAMFHLWNALASYVDQHRIGILFGVASFHGTDTQALAAPLSLLHYRHLAPDTLRVRAQESAYCPMALVPEAKLDRKAAMRQMPSLIKAYLRLGGFVGEGAYVDHAFNTTDVCLVVDTDRMNDRQAAMYRGQIR